MNFKKKQPCNNCPYRKDAPLQLWDKEEFKDLRENENKEPLEQQIYGCHKADGHVCIGWLMMQDKNNLPSIPLRLSLSKSNVDRNYLDNLHCKSEMYNSVEEMIKANYPEI